MKYLQFSLALLGALMFSAAASAASIGVSYAGDNGGGTSIQITAAQTAGVVAQTNWNAANGGGGALAGLVDDSGAATSASVTWSSANTWGGASASTDDAAMVNGWLDDGGSGSLSTVTGIPYARYDVYVYGSSDAGNAGRGWSSTINGTLVNSDSVYVDPVSADGSYFDGSTYVDEAAGTDNPNYAVLLNQSGDLRIEGLRATINGIDSRGSVAGFQIVERVPEPASLLLGLAAMGLGLVARRRV